MLGILTSSVFICVHLWFSSTAKGEDRFPPPEFRTTYQIPQDQFPARSAPWWDYVDSGLLLAALATAVWLVFYRRSRREVMLLTIFAVAWFGFFRKGCVCPIGSIQNVTEAIATGGALPWVVAVFFALPLLFVLLYGRVFCSSVCPLGAFQDLVSWKGLHVPRWLEESLGLLAYLYLGLACMYAAAGGPYIICQYDPFVPMFRLNGPSHMFFLGGVLLALGVVIGRPYCRFLCPYGVILRLLSRLSRKQVTITPAECINCRLCEKSCPFGAIRLPTTQDKPLPVSAGKRGLISVLAVSPLIIVAMAGVGYLAGPTLALAHRDVQLAQAVMQQDAHAVMPVPDEVKAFRDTGGTAEELYAQLPMLVRRFRIGGALVGVWMGLAIGGKLIAYSIRRRNPDYTADPGTCIACARCFMSCPVELKRRGLISELPVVEAMGKP